MLHIVLTSAHAVPPVFLSEDRLFEVVKECGFKERVAVWTPFHGPGSIYAWLRLSWHPAAPDKKEVCRTTEAPPSACDGVEMADVKFGELQAFANRRNFGHVNAPGYPPKTPVHFTYHPAPGTSGQVLDLIGLFMHAGFEVPVTAWISLSHAGDETYWMAYRIVPSDGSDPTQVSAELVKTPSGNRNIYEVRHDKLPEFVARANASAKPQPQTMAPIPGATGAAGSTERDLERLRILEQTNADLIAELTKGRDLLQNHLDDANNRIVELNRALDSVRTHREVESKRLAAAETIIASAQFQEIGVAIGMTVGQDVAPKILPTIKSLQSRIHGLVTTNQALEQNLAKEKASVATLDRMFRSAAGLDPASKVTGASPSELEMLSTYSGILAALVCDLDGEGAPEAVSHEEILAIRGRLAVCIHLHRAVLDVFGPAGKAGVVG